MPFSLNRRQLLGSIGILAGSTLWESSSSEAFASALGATLLPKSKWLQHENSRAGSTEWLSHKGASIGALDGYASTTSVNRGESLNLFVSTTYASFIVKVFRMGYYQGLGARLIETSSKVTGHVQTIPSPDQLGTVDCNWESSLQLSIGHHYPPGQYLALLVAPDQTGRFVPFLVRDDSSKAAFVYMSSVTTWQAYNAWGGFSLYRGANQDGDDGFNDATRADVVSFNRPYSRSMQNGAGDFLGNEFPFLFLAEQLGLDMTYWTSLDLHERGNLLSSHKALLSLGHDEYYSPAMRDAVTTAVSNGLNVSFFGANFIYRKIRFEPSANGHCRLMVNYRSTADPIMATNPQLATVNWQDYPSGIASSTFTGSYWGGVDGAGSLEVENASTWLWANTGLSNGAVLPNALGGEFNHYVTTAVNPANVEILASSNVGGGESDVTYVAAANGGGVFCSGTGHWIYDLSNFPKLYALQQGYMLAPPIANVTFPIRRATVNVLSLFGSGPAGASQPSTSTPN